MHAEQQVKLYANGKSMEFSQFKPAAVDLHYAWKKQKLSYRSVYTFAMQIDSSVDSKKKYNFIFAWFNSVETPLEMQTWLVCAQESEKHGAEVLYCVAQFSFDKIGLTKEV